MLIIIKMLTFIMISKLISFTKTFGDNNQVIDGQFRMEGFMIYKKFLDALCEKNI